MKTSILLAALPLSALVVSCGESRAGGVRAPVGPSTTRGQATGSTQGVVDLPPVEPPPVAFANVANQVGIGQAHNWDDACINSVSGSGSAWADFDNDGDLDLFVTSMGAPNSLYRNEGDLDGDGLPDFQDVAPMLGIGEGDSKSLGCVFIDYDNDGDQDLYVTHVGGNTLWRNSVHYPGEAVFDNVTPTAGLQDDGRCVTSAWADFDSDGYLDLYLAKYPVCFQPGASNSRDRLYHSNGDGTFDDWSNVLCDSDCRVLDGLAFTAGWLDYDNDGDQDLYLVKDHIAGADNGDSGNRHWRNDGPDGAGGWAFTEVSTQIGSNVHLNGMGLAVGDYNNDGWLDMSSTNIRESSLLRGRMDGTFEEVTFDSQAGYYTISRTGWGTLFFDADNDGWEDLYVANGTMFGSLTGRNVLLRNLQDGTFEDVSDISRTFGGAQSRNVSRADFNRDGWVDLFVGNLGSPPSLYLNATGADHVRNWLVVTVEGTDSNRDGIGTRVRVTTPQTSQIREISSGPSHGGGDHRAAYFGLDRSVGCTLRVNWPNGVEQLVGYVLANQSLHLIEPRQP